MEKPIATVGPPSFDYLECCAYLEKKYGYKERDYHETYPQDNDDWEDYMDFWHWVLDKGYSISNDSNFTMYEEWGEDALPWQKEILMRYMDEFGTGDLGEREIYFWISW
jgi:hypothetical protein